MVGYKLLYQVFNFVVGITEANRFLGAENHIFYFLHFCGRAGQAALFSIGSYEICTPFLDLQIIAGFYQRFAFVVILKLARSCRIFVFLQRTGVARSALVGTAINSYQQRQGSLNRLNAVLYATFDGDFPSFTSPTSSAYVTCGNPSFSAICGPT